MFCSDEIQFFTGFICAKRKGYDDDLANGKWRSYFWKMRGWRYP